MKHWRITAIAVTCGFITLFGCQQENNTEAEASATKQEIKSKNSGSQADAASSEAQQGTPEISFEKEIHDFGKIKQGDKVKHTFHFTNTGNAPLVIDKATASCGCTVPEWPQDPVRPDEKGKIKVVFNSSGKKGLQKKTVSITANTKPEVSKITIKADVKPFDKSEGPVKN